ncbi:MAG: sensor histidine kinase [Desulfobacterales bacterium]|nr:MAG: sensor histidine kinase [Desulfobacterales bacterium]
MEQDRALNVAIVGGGPGCKAIMDIIFAEKLSQLDMKLIGVACTNPNAVGYRYAQEKGIYTTSSFRDLYKLKELDMIIELTGRNEVADEISVTKPSHIRLIDHVAARLFWDIFQIEEKRIAERTRAEQELRESREQLRELSAHLQAAREEERTIVARKVHDDLGQTLIALKMDLCSLEKGLHKDQEILIQQAKSMKKLIDMTIQSVKRIYSGLRPFLLDELGLNAAIEWMSQRFQDHTGITCELAFSRDDILLEENLVTNLFRIFQEALTNAGCHANATKVKVRLEEKAGALVLTVTDNGKGITDEQVSDPKSFGLMAIKERVRVLGGDVNISGIKDKGTTVTVSIPMGK